jgi:hypothetical protein
VHVVRPVVPLEGGWWGKSFDLQNRLTPLALALGLFVTVPNIKDGLHDQGIDGLWDTRSGRTGVFQAALTALSLGTLAVAAAPGWRGGLRGMDAAVNAAHWRADWWLVGLNLGLAPWVFLNELGTFDGANVGDDRSLIQSMGDSSARVKDAIVDKRGWIGAGAAAIGGVSLVAGIHAGKVGPALTGGLGVAAGAWMVANKLF